MHALHSHPLQGDFMYTVMQEATLVLCNNRFFLRGNQPIIVLHVIIFAPFYAGTNHALLPKVDVIPCFKVEGFSIIARQGFPRWGERIQKEGLGVAQSASRPFCNLGKGSYGEVFSGGT